MRLFISGEGLTDQGTRRWRAYCPFPLDDQHKGVLAIERVKGEGFSVTEVPEWLHDDPQAVPGWSFAECIKRKASWQGVEEFIRGRLKLDAKIMTAKEVCEEARRLEAKKQSEAILALQHQLAEAKEIIVWAQNVIEQNLLPNAPDYTGRNPWLARAKKFLG